jgi:hypothetical protein
LEELRRSPVPLDDDQLAARLDVQPRQRINQACRGLERAGRLRRYAGPVGKIVNDAHADDSAGVVGDGASERLSEVLAGDSAEQRRAESAMIDILGGRLGIVLAPRRFALDNGVRVEVDGADERLTVLVEAWAHQGTPKSAQKNKVLADALRLLYVASTLPTAPRLFLCLSDPAAARHFTEARSWAAAALRKFGIGVEIVPLPEDVRAAVLAAQIRQYR